MVAWPLSTELCSAPEPCASGLTRISVNGLAGLTDRQIRLEADAFGKASSEKLAALQGHLHKRPRRSETVLHLKGSLLLYQDG